MSAWPYEWTPFPTDEMSLTLLEAACNINEDTGHTELQRFLNMTAGPVKSVEMDGIEYDSVEAALADHDYDTPPILTIEREPGHEPHTEHSVIISLIAEIRRLRPERDSLFKRRRALIAENKDLRARLLEIGEVVEHNTERKP